MASTDAISPIHRRVADFREMVSLFLETKGVPNTPRPSHRVSRKKLSEVFAEPESPRGDLWHVPNWVIAARIEQTRNLSGALAEVERDAEIQGSSHGAVVFRRTGREVADSYVLMSLDSFADTLREARDHG